MTTQKEVDKALNEAHREQDRSHSQTAQKHKEIMRLIEKAGEGLSCRENTTGSATAR